MPTQDQLDELDSACLNIAAGFLLEKSGEFFAFAFELAANGQILPVALMEEDDHPPSQQVIDNLIYVLRERAGSGEIVASAMAVDIGMRRSPYASQIDAVQVRLPATDYVRDLIVPYVIETSGFFRKHVRSTSRLLTHRPLKTTFSPD